MEQKLLGKVALVTGAARGLGRAYALRLANLGADVVINDINLESHKEVGEQLSAITVMDEIENLGRRSIGIKADVSKKPEVDAMFKKILDEFGRIDILVNNAGSIPVWMRDKDPDSEQYFRFVFDINFMGTMFCCQAASIPMMKQRSGKIVNVGSDHGIYPLRGRNAVNIPYGVAKAAIIFYTKILAIRLGPYGINVNCIAPAHILTRTESPLFKREQEEIRERRITLGRLGVSEDCAKVIEFLTTDLSNYITGQVIPVSGGSIKCPS